MATKYFDPTGLNPGASPAGTIGDPYTTMAQLAAFTTTSSTINVNNGRDPYNIASESGWTTYTAVKQGWTSANKIMTWQTYGTGAATRLDCYRSSTSTSDWEEIDPTATGDVGAGIPINADGTAAALLPGSNVWHHKTIRVQVNYIRFGSLTSLEDYVTAANYASRGQATEHQKVHWFNNATTLGVNDAALKPRAYGHWDSPTPATTFLCVYSVGNPVTYYGTIYFAFAEDAIIQSTTSGTNSATHSFSGLSFGHCGTALYLRNQSTGDRTANPCVYTVTGCTFYNCGSPVRWTTASYTAPKWIGGSANNPWNELTVTNCGFKYADYSAIYGSGYIRSGRISYNSFEMCSLQENTGAIFFAGHIALHTKETYIHHNSFKRCAYHGYWKTDGGAVDCDTNTADIWIYDNEIDECAVGMQMEGGRRNVQAFRNVMTNVGVAFNIGDVAGTAIGELEITIDHNTVVLATPGYWPDSFTLSNTTGKSFGMLIVFSAGAPESADANVPSGDCNSKNNGWRVRNNVWVATTASGTYGFMNRTFGSANAYGITNLDNHFENFTAANLHVDDTLADIRATDTIIFDASNTTGAANLSSATYLPTSTSPANVQTGGQTPLATTAVGPTLAIVQPGSGVQDKRAIARYGSTESCGPYQYIAASSTTRALV